ncbi:DUF2501 domain-containing protein [Rhizosaccharibacter radicis]|uniref:DUF2501 domain-containing protein n=1 Tax=Rhizosaccharibacter radicis TaxID=2782605 RepID=A0ABT1VUT9_9PROT|nr:DUF2501 domain-containing protein [Acetobacteraceae bacterium KSS12]
MNRPKLVLGALASLPLLAAPAVAQEGTGLYSSQRVATPLGGNTGINANTTLGGLAQRFMPGMPNLNGASGSNLAGVLSYCLQNNEVQNGAASAALGAATQNGTASSNQSAFQLGQQGQLQTGNGNTLSVAGLKDQVRQRVCQMVMSRVQAMR